MKSTTLAIAVGAISLLQLAIAQPHGARRHLHDHQNVKKDANGVAMVYAEAADAPKVIIYVDQDGIPLSTVTRATAAGATPAPADTPTTSIEVAAAAAAATGAASAAPSSSVESSGFGVAYSPYNKAADIRCKTAAQVATDIAYLASQNTYSLVRIYGTDCNQVVNVLSAIQSTSLKLFAGIYDLSNISGDIATIAAAANGNWTAFDTVSVGNELVNSGAASAAAVVAAIGQVRTGLKAQGYTGKVVTVDTLVAARANPSLCDASDFCAVNCHPFFDGNTVAEDSGKFLTTQIPTLSAVLANPNQEIVVTETGWPWKGDANNLAVPSVANQAAAVSSIQSAFTSKQNAVILFTAFNDGWKELGAYNAEPYWGISTSNSPSDPNP